MENKFVISAGVHAVFYDQNEGVQKNAQKFNKPYAAIAHKKQYVGLPE